MTLATDLAASCSSGSGAVVAAHERFSFSAALKARPPVILHTPVALSPLLTHSTGDGASLRHLDCITS